MKCIYFLSPTLKSAEQISQDIKSIGVDEWFIHIHSKNESGVVRQRLHSSNYLETLDFLRKGIMGAGIGFVAGVIMAFVAAFGQIFGPVMSVWGYLAIVFVFSCFGAWVGGLTGVAKENKKIANFSADIDAGAYLILIYAKDDQIEAIKQVMTSKHQEACLAAVDPHFYNPFADLQLVRS